MGPDMMTIMNNHRQEAEGPMRTINGGDTISSSPATEVGNHNLLPAVTHLHTSKTDDNGDIYSPPRTPESETRHPISPGLDTPNKGLNESRESHSNEDDHELDLSYKNQFETSSVGNSDPDSDFDKDYDKGGLSPGSPRRPHNYNRRFDPSINPYNPIFATEEARLRLALGKVGSEIKERFNHFQTGGVEEGTRPGFLSSKPDSDLYSSGNIGSPESSPEPKSLSSPHHPFDGPYGLSGGQFQSLDEQDSALIPRVKEGIYFCHLCSFSGSTQADFDLHMTCHFEHVCPHCDYKSRTEGRLKRHIKDFHTEDSDGLSRTMPGRPKVFRCKQCEFSTTEKIDFWTHSRTHIKEDKLLQCPRCPFVTEYKHHLEYHLRNHFGSKPFKCPKCNYACVNKSMLNSHMKSHTNVYQYRCSDCTYATKYCHSLKLHLRKYNHKPAAVLNSDGSLPQGVDATNSGHSLLSKRGPPRGPRGPRRDKLDSPIGPFPPMMHSPLGHMPGMPLPGMMSPYWPLLHGPMPNGLPSPLGMPPRFNMPIPGMRDNIMNGGIDEITLPANPIPFKCNLCSFVGNGYESLASHVMKVHASENRDLFSMFGISSDAILEESRRKLDSLCSPLKSPPNSMLPVSEHSPLGLKIKTEVHDDVMTSPRPPLPERHNNMKNGFSRHPQLPSGYPFMNGKIPSRDTKDEGVDILKQMTLKFGSGPSGLEKSGATDSPLDLTKPRSPPSLYTQQYPPGPIHSSGRNDDGEHSSSETSTGSNVTSPQPRKRSRKGQAFKLDTLCLKLQERHGGANSYISDDDSIGDGDDRSIPEVNGQNTSAHNDYEQEDTTPAKRSRSEFSNSENENASVNGERNPDSDDVDVDDTDNDLGDDIPVKLTCNENRNDRSTDPDFNQIHSNLKILNSEIQIQDDKVDDHKKMNDSYRVMTERENKKNGENVNVTPVIQYQSRRKPVAAAIQKGADLALKLWNNPYITDPAAFKNGYGKTEISHLDKKLWSEAPSCTSVHRRDKNGNFECPHCQIAFGDFIMYTMHMGYHGYKDPYKCNMCGNTCKDRVEFFLHIARAAHN